jgi:hypothetical protein
MFEYQQRVIVKIIAVDDDVAEMVLLLQLD